MTFDQAWRVATAPVGSKWVDVTAGETWTKEPTGWMPPPNENYPSLDFGPPQEPSLTIKAVQGRVVVEDQLRQVSYDG